jgi:uncharacterized protein
VGAFKTVKVVLDTNVIVSALLFGGLPGRLRPLWRERFIQPFVSQAIIDEYLRVLAYPKFQLTRGKLRQAQHVLQRHGTRQARMAQEETLAV